MMAQTQHPQIDAALARARARWLNSATINAGGRWAVLPAAGAAVVGVSLAVAGVRDVLPLAAVGAVGVAGVIATLVMTRQTFARPGRPGAPDYTLALDRALGLNDALPALVESPGAFSGALAERVARGLDPVREKQAAPPRQWAPLIVALLLCLLPMAALAPQAAAHGPDSQLAGSESSTPAPGGNKDSPESGDLGQPAPDQDPESGGAGSGANASAGADGRPQQAPATSAGEAPSEKPKPDPSSQLPRPTPAGTGDETGPPPEPQVPQPEGEVESRPNPITPDAGEGETRKELRDRWLYNPAGTPLPGALTTPPPLQASGERQIARQKVTSSERKALEQLYDKLYR